MRILKGILIPLRHWLLALGPVGLFVMAMLDSCSIPVLPELLMIRLTFEHPHKVWLYVLITTAGSTLGTMIIFGLARHWGGPWVERKMPPKRFRKVHRALEDYDVFAVAVPAMLPPPMPFKLFVLTAGIFEISWFDFIVSMFVGRGIRYAAEAYLAVHYGSRAWAYIRGHIWGLAIAATLLMGFGYWMGHVRHRGAAEAER